MTVAVLTEHPAKWTPAVLDRVAALVLLEQRQRDEPIGVLDPFAGVGRIHDLAVADKVVTVGVELEPEWAACRESTLCGDMLTTVPQLVEATRRFHVVATSPCYGNRFADHHTPRDGSPRRSYKFSLRRDPSSGSAAVMQWGDDYRTFHLAALRVMVDALEPGGLLVVNMKNHVRGKQVQRVVEWWTTVMLVHGLALEQVIAVPVDTDRRYNGANGQARVGVEHVIVMRRPPT